MSCSVAVASSPVFTPSMIPLTCKTTPESLTLGLTHHHLSSTAADVSPSAPFRRFQRGAGGFRNFTNEPSASSFTGFDASAVSPSNSSSAQPSCFSSVLASNSCGSASLLKRKRPARLDIPMVGLLAFNNSPLGTDGRREVEAGSARYSVYCKRGRKRLEMEDRHTAVLDLLGDSHMAFFGIFDGHGGSKAAQYVSKNIGDRIMEEVMTEKVGGEGVTDVKEAVRNGYLRTDADFLKENVGGGTCCVTAFIRNGDLIVSNAGDCRAILSVSGEAEALTSDHRPSRKDEKDRIESLGGYVNCCRGVWRLQDSLAVSRGIGDSHLKQWVIPDPETRIRRIEPDCEFLILASDGLWDKVGNQEAVDIARPLCMNSQKTSPLSACKKLVELSVSRGSMDDNSVMIIQLGHFV